MDRSNQYPHGLLPCMTITNVNPNICACAFLIDMILMSSYCVSVRRCKHLSEVDLRAFKLEKGSLRQLLENNAASLKTLILPDGVREDLMELLSGELKSLRSLEKLSVTAANFPGLMGSLPMSLAINIRGEISR